jgi:hypothetical protein
MTAVGILTYYDKPSVGTSLNVTFMYSVYRYMHENKCIAVRGRGLSKGRRGDVVANRTHICFIMHMHSERRKLVLNSTQLLWLCISVTGIFGVGFRLQFISESVYEFPSSFGAFLTTVPCNFMKCTPLMTVT